MLGRVDHPEQAGKLGVGPDDLRRHLEDLRGLLPVVGRRIDFSVLDRLRPDEMNQDERGDQGGLAVLPGDRKDGPPNAAPRPPIGVYMRGVDVPDEPLLPIPEPEFAALPFSGRDGQLFNELDNSFCPIRPANLLFC